MKLSDLFRKPTPWELKRRQKCDEIKRHLTGLYPKYERKGSWDESHGGEICTFHGVIRDQNIGFEINTYDGWLYWWETTCIEEIIQEKGIDYNLW